MPTHTPAPFRTVTTHTPRRALVVALTLLMAVGTVVATPSPAMAAVPEVRTPLHSGVDISGPLAVYGTNMVFGTHRSVNGGTTWASDLALAGVTWKSADSAQLVGYRWLGGSSTAIIYSMVDGAQANYSLPATPQSMSRTWAVWNDSSWKAYNFVAGVGSPIAMTPPSGITMSDMSARIISGDRVLWWGLAPGYRYGQYIAISASPTSAPGPWVNVDGSLDTITTATQLQYVLPTGYVPNQTVNLCSRELTNLSAPPTCRAVVSGGDIWGEGAQLYNFGSTTVVNVVTVSGANVPSYTPFLWDGSNAVKIQLPPGSQMLWRGGPVFDMYGDTPYMLVSDSNTVPSLRKINADGSSSPGPALPPLAVANVGSLAVAPDRVVGADARDGSEVTPAWTRPVSASGFGTETVLPTRSSLIKASAARTVSSGPTGLAVYDRGTLRNTIADARMTELSGPYITRQVPSSTGGYDVEAADLNGKVVGKFTGTTGSLFGSEYVTWTNDGTPTGTTHVVVNDLTGLSAPRAVDLPTGSGNCTAGRVWNSTLVMLCGNYAARAFDLRTGALIADLPHPANEIVVSLLGVGDGYAIVGLNFHGYNVWDIATGTLTSLGTCGRQFTTDGVGHVACVSDTELIWRDFSSLSTTSPRVLGALAAPTADFSNPGNVWTVDLDATKPLKAGGLVISDSHGTVVRTLATPASSDGSVRAVSWDGMNASGKPVPAGPYTYRLAADAADGTGAVTAVDGSPTAAAGQVVVTSASPAGMNPGAVMAVSPSRILDTRITGPNLGAGQTRTVKVTGVGGVPSTGVSAVILNITVTETTYRGFLTAYPTGSPRPNVSNLNWAGGATIPNAVTVKLGTGGSIDLFQSGPGSAQVIVDVTGYFVAGSVVAAGGFTSVTPSRILDTRLSSGEILAGQTQDLQVTGVGGVPDSNVSAVVLNVTVTETSTSGFLTAFPSGSAKPVASNLNWSAPGTTIPNLVTVKVGSNGKVSLFQSGPGSAQAVVDVAGYYLSGTPTQPGMFVVLSPARILDTRTTSPVAPRADLVLTVLNAGGIPATGVSAVVVNTTVTETKAPGYLTVYPGTSPRPISSSLNWLGGTTIANLVTIQTGTDGTIRFRNESGGSTQVVADIAGYYLG